MVDRCICGRRGRGRTPCFDDRGSALRNGGDQRFAVPRLVSDTVGELLAVEFGIPPVGKHRRRMVSPDDELCNRIDTDTRLGGKLSLRAVVIKADHRRDVFGRETRCALRKDPGICIGGIADDQDLGVAFGHCVQRYALRLEDRCVGSEQITALHAL